MSCGLFDPLACVPPEVWTSLDTFWLALKLWPWFAALGIVSLILGAWLGPARTAVLVSGGIALLFLANRHPEPPQTIVEGDDSRGPKDFAIPRSIRQPARKRKTLIEALKDLSERN